MKLEEKGEIIPPPVLSKYSEIVSQEIQQWPSIISATHWEIWNRNKPNGADFYVGEKELGHIHLDGSIHIPSTQQFAKALINSLNVILCLGIDYLLFCILHQPAN